MKSKQIVKHFIIKSKDLKDQELINQAIDRTVKIFIDDFINLRKARNIRFDSGLIPLFKELDQKWNTVRALLFKHYKVHLIKYNGFRIILKTRMPVAYKFYMKSLKH